MIKNDVLKLTWLMGQRIGDILRLKSRNIFRVQTPHSNSIACLFTSGKVVQRTGPCVIHLPMGGESANIITLALTRTKKLMPYVFMDYDGPPLNETDEMKLVSRYEEHLKSLEEMSFDMRALRRGGLSSASLLGGFSKDELRELSRHPSNDTLRLYLAAGILDNESASTQMKIIRTNEESMKNATLGNGFSVVHYADLLTPGQQDAQQ